MQKRLLLRPQKTQIDMTGATLRAVVSGSYSARSFFRLYESYCFELTVVQASNYGVLGGHGNSDRTRLLGRNFQ